MRRLAPILLVAMLVGCSDPVSVDVGIDSGELTLTWNTTPYPGGWNTTVTGSAEADGRELWMRFDLEAGEYSLIAGGPPPLTASIIHQDKDTPINYGAELSIKVYAGSGWTWEIIDTLAGTYEAPIIP